MPETPRASSLIDKTIVTEEQGKRYGDVDDISFVTDTGELMNILITNTTEHIEEDNLQEDRKGRNLIPFSAVRSIGDFIIVSEDDIL